MPPEDPPSSSGDDGTETDASCERDRQDGWPPTPAVVHPHQLIPMREYRRLIQIFHQQAFRIWPVVDGDDLLAKLSQPDPDPETLALAASLCAATIAQLRLPEHTGAVTPLRNAISSSHFATECLWLRELYDYRENYSIAAVLIPFFLHIYFANINKLRTAGLLLRESITYVHAMRLGQPETYRHLEKGERCLRLRIYWLLFISER